MRVLILTHRFFPTHRAGTEVLTLQLAQGLRGRGHQVAVITGEHDVALSCDASPWLTSDTYDGLTIHRLHYGTAEQTWRRHGLRKKLAVGVRMLTGDFDPIALQTRAPDRVAIVRKLVMDFKPDVVHINHVIGFSVDVIPEIRCLGFPVIFTPTDYFTLCPTDQLLRGFDRNPCQGPGDAIDCVRCIQPMPWWAAHVAMDIAGSVRLHGIGAVFRSLATRCRTMIGAIKAADRILPSTRFLADMLVRHGAEEDSISVIPYGIDIGELPPLLSVPERFHSQSKLRLGFIGKLVEPKGAHVILAALSRLGVRINEVCLDIYAETDFADEYCNSFVRQAQSLGESVRFAGTFPSKMIGQILRSLHVLIIPSIWYESIPLVLRSALNAGTPVIVSRMGGLTEPLSGDVFRQSFPAGDAVALRDLILDLLDDPQRLTRRRMELIGKARMLKHYIDEVEAQYHMAAR
jgi:glycosyltransferase involved in cell wall biosynthesis